MKATTLEAKYRARTFDASDERALRDAFDAVVAIRLRPLRLPEAGGSFEIWLLFSFVGSAIGQTLIGDATSAARKSIVSGIRAFYEHKIRKQEPPELVVTFSYDDVDIRIPSVAHSELGLLDDIHEAVKARISTGALLENKPTVLVIGLAREDEQSNEWYEPSAANGLEPNRRFWGASLEGHRALTHVYDTQTGLLASARIW